MKEITVTKYVIQFEPRFKGWIAFKVVTAKDRVLDRSALTTAKPAPHLAARSLARILSIKE